jgi:hypothetical protein
MNGKTMNHHWIAIALMIVPCSAWAAEPGTPQVPEQVRALAGCWEGRGAVMDKPVTLAIAARPIADDALLSLDAYSVAVAKGTISGFWSDSFGGAYTATGKGEGTADGFDITYAYPDTAFVNRWRIAGDQLTWRIVALNAKGAEQPFASYALRKAACKPQP